MSASERVRPIRPPRSVETLDRRWRALPPALVWYWTQTGELWTLSEEFEAREEATEQATEQGET